jgi:hypothetical protein
VKHLTPTEIVDLLEGKLTDARLNHADECPACRREVEELRHVLLRSADTSVSEPSPLFWDHFAARVREEIGAGERARSKRFAWLGARHAVTAGAVTAVLVLVVAVLNAPERREQATDVPAAAGADLLAREAPHAEEAWAAVRAAAEDVRPEDVHEAGIVARPGSADRAIDDLTEAERRELLQLLEHELKGSGA